MATAKDFKDFDTLINEYSDPIYLVYSRHKTGTGVPISFNDAMSALGSDPLAEIGIFLPKGYACIEFSSQELADCLVKIKADFCLFKIKSTYYIYGKDEIIRNTKNNLTGCGIYCTTHAYKKKPTAIPLPFKPTSNTSTLLKDSQMLNMATTMYMFPFWLRPVYFKSMNISEAMVYPITSNYEDNLVKLYNILDDSSFNRSIKRNIMQFVNDNFCDSPLTVDELDNVFNCDVLMSEVGNFFDDKKNFLHHKMGEFVMNELSLKRDVVSGQIFFWDDRTNIYNSDNRIIFSFMTQVFPAIKEYQRQEVMKYIESMLAVDDTQFNQDPTTIVFKNGTLDLATLDFKDTSPEDLETIQINCNYNPNAKGPVADDFFKTATCGNKDVEKLLYEAIGYSLLKTSDLGISFLLLGSGKNGKSTYLDIIKEILGRKNFTTISFKDMATTFRSSALINKLASLAGDISSQPIQESDFFKSITAGEEVMVEEKYKASDFKKLFATMFFSANKLPPTPDLSDGFFRRICIIPFNAKLENVSRINGMFFKKKLLAKECVEYVAYKAVLAIQNVFNTTMEFTIPDCVKDAIHVYKIKNSSVLCWFHEVHKEDGSLLTGQTLTGIYTGYKDWAKDNGYRACKKSKFEEVLASSYPELEIVNDRFSYTKIDPQISIEEQMIVADFDNAEPIDGDLPFS